MAQPPGSSPEPAHVGVMVKEVLEFLGPKPGNAIVDATLGAGGYSDAILHAIGGEGTVLGIDRDPEAVELASSRLAGWGTAFKARKADFADLPEVLSELGIAGADGLVGDLGISSMQLGSRSRGFSFQFDGPLDMRMDPEQELTAEEVINTRSERDLERILREYGEERFARRIARAIVRRRRQKPLRSTGELVEVIERTVPGRRSRIHPATRCFQAVRIETNDELGQLRTLCARAPDILKPGGVFACISFHSLEDRIVKHSLRQRELWELLTKKPITPTAEEVDRNPRSRSAKLRAAKRK